MALVRIAGFSVSSKDKKSDRCQGRSTDAAKARDFAFDIVDVLIPQDASYIWTLIAGL